MKKTFRRCLSLLLVVTLCLGMVSIPAEAAAETVVEWNYTAVPTPDATIAPATGGANMEGAVLTNSQNSDMTYSSNSLCTKGWDAGNQYWQLSFSTKDYENLTIEAQTRASNTGPRDFKVQYSLDGTSYVDITGTDYENTSNLDYYMGKITLPGAINDQALVYIRFVNKNSTSVKGETVLGTGTSNINNIVVRGETLSAETKCATPTASAASGAMASGTQISLACNTGGATIYYTDDDTEPTIYDIGSDTNSTVKYTGPITLSGNNGETVTIKAIAAKDGLENSDISEFNYTIINSGAIMNIKQVLGLPSGTGGVSVTGQIAYFAKSDNNPVIQDVIDGKTYSLYIYGATLNGAKVGDMVKLTGTYSIYNGLPELMSVTASEITGSAAAPAPETHTIAELKANGTDMIGRFVKLESITLGEYKASGSTSISQGTDTINIYQATEYPICIEEGDIVDLYAMVAVYNSTVQLYTGSADANGYNVYDPVNDEKPPVITIPDSLLSAGTGKDYKVSVDAADNKGIQSVTISYIIGTEEKADQTMEKNTETGKYEYTIPGSEIPATATDIKFTVKAVDVTGLETKSDEITVAVDDKPRVVMVTPTRGSATGDNKSPEISVTLENAGETPTVVMTLKKGSDVVVSGQAMTLKAGETAVYAYTPQALDDGKYSVSVTVTRTDGGSLTESWSFTVGEALYTAYFGQLHAHTAEYSDGSGKLQDGLNYLAAIPESDNVDFVSFTDHSNYFDSKSAANPAEALNNKALMTDGSKGLWNTYVSTMKSFNSEHSGSLVALPGFEMTWSGGPGHINTFNSDGLISRNNEALDEKVADAGMKMYYDTLIQNTDSLANLSQFNHPGKTFGTFSDFAYWNASYDNKMVAVEVGNGEGAIGSGGYFPSYTEYTKALDKGWHVAPTNNQDNHKGHWGNSNTSRTVILTDNFSDEGLLQGMKDMSVYATEDKNLNITYTVNDLVMGSIIDEVPDEPLKFAVNIDDPDNDDVISKVEIVTNSGRVSEAKTFSSNTANWEFELPSVQGYYYVRVTQADQNIAVTAPVWVGQAPLLGISSLECGTNMPVTDEEVSLTTKLFNNESSSAVLKSITYSLDGTVIGNETPGTEIVKEGTTAHVFRFTPSKAGNATVSVTTVLRLNGIDKEYTSNIKLNVRDKDKLVYVGIDASHYNEYVRGNYSHSMGNFANLAINYDVRVVELETSADLISATQNPKYQMLVLTPPTRRKGLALLTGYKNYSDEEVAAVADFAKAGGMVIVTGWGDYYESYAKFPQADHMAAQQNRLLSAIGASLRVSDDEIKDDKNNGGQPQRLYLTNYNMENTFLDNVVPEKQVYSNYGGSTIYAVGGDGKPSVVLPSSVSPMVYAFETSFSSDDDNDYYGTGTSSAIAIPKYDNKYMVAASETVAHSNGKTSTVIVAGSAFMSNFEIQAEMDSYLTPEYSNYTILQNVLSNVNPVTVTDISDVQAADEGKTFTIRGIATSNASGYEQETAFFDCIYVQDNTAGINVFPVSGNIQAGQTLEITGTTSSYQGERQLLTSPGQTRVIDGSIKPLPEAIEETTTQAADGAHLGSLVKVKGTITRYTTPNGAVESIYVKDDSGKECRVFIDGYITKEKTIANLAVGAKLTAVGLSSIDTEGARIRIRDRGDVVCTANYNGGGHGGKNNDQKPADPKEEVVSSPDGKNVVHTTTIKGSIDTATGRVKAEFSGDTAKNLVEEAKQSEASGNTSVIEIKVDTPAQGTAVSLEISKEILKEIATGTKAQMKMNTGLGSVTFSAEAIKSINKGAAEDLNFSIAKVEKQELSDTARATVGDRPVYDFSVKSGESTITNFNSNVEVSLPYTPAAGEDKNAIVVYYIDDSGSLKTVRGCYNAAEGTVNFITTHFSKYVIGYNKVNFSDVSDKDWFSGAVSFIASRDITTGTDKDLFSPDLSLSRGQFIVMLMRAYGISPDEHPADNFADAGSTYYTNYLSAAKRLGITGGVGDNLYAPDALITREDMFTLLYRALDMLDEIPEKASSGKSLSSFKDSDQISDYAQEAMESFAKDGVISGSGGMLNPDGLSSRAEMAQVLYNLLSK